jgi:hypothetical protein
MIYFHLHPLQEEAPLELKNLKYGNNLMKKIFTKNLI